MIHPHDSSIVRTMSRMLIPLIQLFALYVLFFGQYGPGGGFVGGVMLGAGLILGVLVFGPEASSFRLAKRVLHGDGIQKLGNRIGKAHPELMGCTVLHAPTGRIFTRTGEDTMHHRYRTLDCPDHRTSGDGRRILSQTVATPRPLYPLHQACSLEAPEQLGHVISRDILPFGKVLASDRSIASPVRDRFL